jgi:membrane protease YdiL (CAAX protease family)
VVAVSVVIAWVYLNTGSLLLAMLTHAAVNAASGIVPSATTEAGNWLSPNASAVGWLTVALWWARAAYLLVRMRDRGLPRPELPLVGDGAARL